MIDRNGDCMAREEYEERVEEHLEGVIPLLEPVLDGDATGLVSVFASRSVLSER